VNYDSNLSDDRPASLAVVMISLNEARNMRAVLENIKSFAQEIFLVDSYSTDETVDIALSYGVHVVQRRFRGFGDQWNFALHELPITSSWTMKLDPDERVTTELAASIREAVMGDADGYIMERRLWFMARPMPVRQDILRIWRTGQCRFSDVLVNEHPIVEGTIGRLKGHLEHHDSPNLHHWFDKQNRYTSAEALTTFERRDLAATPRLFGNGLERRMWLKSIYRFIPFRHTIMLLYCLVVLGSWRAGKPGFVWARLRALVFKMREDKLTELRILKQAYEIPSGHAGVPRDDVPQFD
jgi:glycosyltransferase involved in cell wall biosynthesis